MRFCQRQRDRGQVLIFAVIVATILLFMAFFLFDLQSMVRLRARSQHGVDAAVLLPLPGRADRSIQSAS